MYVCISTATSFVTGVVVLGACTLCRIKIVCDILQSKYVDHPRAPLAEPLNVRMTPTPVVAAPERC